MDGKVIWTVPFPFDKADCGECWRMGGSSPAAGEPDISCLVVVSGNGCELGPPTYKLDIEGIVRFNASTGCPPQVVLNCGPELTGGASFCTDSEEPFSV